MARCIRRCIRRVSERWQIKKALSLSSLASGKMESNYLYLTKGKISDKWIKCLSDSHREILADSLSTSEPRVMLQHSGEVNVYPDLQPSLLFLSRGGGQNQIKLTS